MVKKYLPHHSIRIFLSLPLEARLLVFGNFINAVGSMIGPFLTLILIQKFHLEPAAAGKVISSYAGGTLFSVIVGGRFTDSFGRRFTLLLSLSVAGTLAFILGLVRESNHFFIILFIYGFFIDLFRPASIALLTDVLPSHQRATGFAASRVMGNIGFAAAMVFGGFFLQWDWRWLFWFDGMSSVLFASLVFLKFSETLKKDSKISFYKEKQSFKGAIRALFPWDDRVYHQALVIGLLASFVYMCHLSLFPITVIRNAHLTERHVGYLLALNGVIIFFFEIAITAAMVGKRRLRIAAVGAALIGLGFILTPIFLNLSWLLFTVALWTFGEIFSFPFLMSFNSDWAPPRKRGLYLSFTQANWRIAHVTNPPIMLYIYENFPIWVVWLLPGLLMIPVSLLMLHLDKNYDKPELLRGRE